MTADALREIVRASSGRVRPDVVSEVNREWPVRCFDTGYGVRAVSIPATEFTGDFYIATEVDESLWFAVGDFSGHGLEASIFMVMVREELERVIHACSRSHLAEVVALLDKTIREELPFNRFASLVVGRAERDGSVSLVNAGHCYPVLVRSDGETETIGVDGPVIGILPAPDWCARTLQLAQGDRLVVYTDGLLEAREPDGEDLGLERIVEVSGRTHHSTVVPALLETARTHSKGVQEDDLTLLVLSRA